MRKTTKPLEISKRAKGFAFKLSNTHLLTILQTYAWLKVNGLTDAETDEGLAAIPTFSEPLEQAKSVDDVLQNGVRCMTCKPDRASGTWKDPLFTISKTRTIRVRAESIQSVIRLFRLCAAFVCYGQIGETLLRRAEDLEEVPILDQLYDAQRGDSVSLTLKD